MARLLDQDEPVVVLVGSVVEHDQCSENADIRMLIAEDTVIDVPGVLGSFLDFLSTPRVRSDVIDWLTEAGADANALDELIAAGRLVEVPAEISLRVLDTFRGVRVVPMGYPVRASQPDGSVLYIGERKDSTHAQPISALLAAAMWEHEKDEDFPATIQRVAGEALEAEEQIVRLSLTGLDGLLAHGLARLEWVANHDG